MKNLTFLKQELLMLQDNIERIERYKKENISLKYAPSQSNVVGEFKHRIITLKSRLTQCSKITTSDLFD